jgi:hypothetical protein
MVRYQAEDTMVDLVGSWELDSLYRQRSDGSRDMAYGAKPKGRLSYTADGVVHAILMAEERPEPASLDISDSDKISLFQTMVAYTGRYRQEGDKVIHTVELSWNQVWEKTELVRFFEVTGDMLRILTAPAIDTLDGSNSIFVLEWRREKLSS